MPRRGENIRKRKDGRWEGRILTINSDGDKYYKSLYGHTYKEVKEKVSSYSPVALKDSDCNIIKIDSLADDLLSNIKTTHKYSTYIKYKGIYSRYISPRIGSLSNIEITDEIINDIFIPNGIDSEGSLSKSTIGSIKYLLIKILKESELDDKSDLINDIYKKVYPATRKNQVLTENEQKKLITYLDNDTDIFKLGIFIALLTGMRLGEICALKKDCIDLENRIITVNSTVQRISDDCGHTFIMCAAPKSLSSNRDIPICDILYSMLVRNVNTHDEYFFYPDKYLEPRTMQKKFSNYLVEAGIQHYSFHSLRHTFATNCIENGMDVKCLSEILGHANVQTTLNRYVHPSDKTKQANINKCTSIYGQILGQK